MNSGIEEFIRSNPDKAWTCAIEWQEAARKYFFPAFATKQEWIDWLSTSKLNLPQDLWIGNEILQVLNAVPPRPEPEPTPEPLTQLNLLNMLGATVLPFAFRNQVGLMEDDPKLKKIAEQKKEEWLKNNPGKDFESREGLDYLYGNLDNPDAPTLEGDAEKEFREKHKKLAERYDRLARKTYKAPDEDPSTQRAKQRIEEHKNQRKLFFERNGAPDNWEEIQKNIERREWDNFAKKYGTKAQAYRQKLKEIDGVLDRQDIRQKLLDYRKSSGREIKFTEKIRREVPKISVEEATKRLEQIKPIVPPQQLYVPHRITVSTPLPPTPPKSPRRRRGMIDFANRIPSFFNTLRNMGQEIRIISSVVQTVARTLFSSPYFWVFFAIIALIVFILFFSSGGGLPFGLGGDEQDQTSQEPSFPPISGLTLALRGPDFINNGELLSYVVDVFYDPSVATVPIEDITVFDSLPSNTDFSDASGVFQFDNSQRLVSWRLSELVNRSGFSITLRPLIDDFFVSNKVYARANIPPPSGGLCSEGSGFCSVQYLSGFFPDTTKARQASIICQRESGSNPAALNNGCLSGRSADYSVGLFQINLFVHCPGAFSSYTLSPPSCTVADQQILDSCVNKFSDPVENIKKAVEISSGGSYWDPWSSAKVCGIIN